LVECNIVLVEYNIGLVECDITLVEYNIVSVDGVILTLLCVITLVEINITQGDHYIIWVDHINGRVYGFILILDRQYLISQ